MIILIVILAILAAIVAAPYLFESRRRVMERSERKNAPGSFAELSQGVTHFRWIGPVRGPVAVCVHGLTTPCFVWNGMAEGLAMLGYRVLVYDLYGRGYSDRPGGPQTSQFFLRQLNDLLDDLDVTDDFTLIGYSMGGAIGTAFTSEQPNRVRQLVLLASGGIQMNYSRLTKFITDRPGIGDWLMLALYPHVFRNDTRQERATPSTVENIVERKNRELLYRGFIPAVLSSMRGILREDMRPRIEAIRDAGVPLLAVWAKEDDVVPITAMGALTQWDRTAKQEVVEGAGHGLIYTHTEQVIDAMRETLHDGLN